MFNIGPGEMMMLGLLALLLFGPKRLPELGRALGEGLAAFRQTSRGVAEEFKRQLDEGAREDSPPPPAPGIPMTPPGPAAEEAPETAEATAEADEPEAVGEPAELEPGEPAELEPAKPAGLEKQVAEETGARTEEPVPAA